MIDFWYGLASVLLGAAISIGVSYYFAHRGSAELQREAERLRRQTTLILRAMEEAGPARFTLDENGVPTSIIINLIGVSKGGSSASGTLTEAEEGPEEESRGAEQ